MTNNCILTELKSNRRLKVWLLFTLLLISIFIVIVTTATQALASTVLLSNEKLTEKSQRISFTEVASKLILADQKRLADPKLFKKLLTELKTTKNSFTAEQRYFYQFLRGYLAAYQGRYDKADNILTKIINSSANTLIKFRANYTLINISAAKKEWSDGLRHISYNTKMLPSIKNKEHYQQSILTSIIFYNQLQQYDLVLKHIDLIKRQTLPEKHNCLLEQLSLEAKLNLHYIKPDDSSIDDGLGVCIKADNKISTNIIRVYRAKLYLKIQQPEKALAEILPHYNEVKNTLFPMLIVGVNNALAESYFQLKNIEVAKDYALAALNVKKYTPVLQQDSDTYKLLYQIAKQQKDIDLALTYHETYSTLERFHLESEKAKHVAFQLTKLNAFENENQIRLLNEENDFLAAEQILAKSKVANIQLIITAMTLIIIMLAIGGSRLWQSHKRVKVLSEYDELTAIYNRRHFNHVAVNALKYCQNSQQELSLIMFDLDHFKKINDNFGHMCGDWALKETIRVCKKIGRKNDIFARLGGEEFCILLPSCNIEAAVLRAEACRAAIENTITEDSGNDFTITASFGVTDVKRSGFDLEKLLADADFATYDSKHSGRNRVTVYEPETPETSVSLANTFSIAS